MNDAILKELLNKANNGCEESQKLVEKLLSVIAKSVNADLDKGLEDD